MSVDSAFTSFYRSDDLLDVLKCYSALESAAGGGGGSMSSVLKLLDQLRYCTLPGGTDLADLLKAKITDCASPAYSNTKVLIVGGGPGGLRTAIEARVLGCQVELIEKRTYFSRSNVLKLWPGPVEDCLSLGLKVFYPKFGSRDSEKVSIRGLQIALLKVALMLGVQVQTGLTFRRVYPPQAGSKLWTVGFFVKGSDNDKAKLQCNVLVGADGENSRVAKVADIKSSVVRFSKALGITFNFKNSRTTAEVKARELARTGFMYNKFFNEVFEKTGVKLENLIYLQEGTHYFVMAAKPATLCSTGILLLPQSQLKDPADFLSSSNVDQTKLLKFAREMAEVVGLPPDLDFNQDYHGRPDAGIFDFTQKRSCHASCKILDSGGSRLLVALVGDAAVAPFWPLGTGANKAILGSFDTAHAIQNFVPIANGTERELGQLLTDQLHVFQLMKSSNPNNLRKNRDRSSNFGNVTRFLWSSSPETRYVGYRRSMMNAATGEVTKVQVGTASLDVNDALDAEPEATRAPQLTMERPQPAQSAPRKKSPVGYGMFRGTKAVLGESGYEAVTKGRVRPSMLKGLKPAERASKPQESAGASWESTRKIKTFTSYADFSQLGAMQDILGHVQEEKPAKTPKKKTGKTTKKTSSPVARGKKTKSKRISGGATKANASSPRRSLKRTPRFGRSVTTEAPASPPVGTSDVRSKTESLNVGTLRRMYSTMARDSLRGLEKETSSSRGSPSSRVKRLSKSFERTSLGQTGQKEDDDIVDVMNGFGTRKFPKELIPTMSMMGFGDLRKLSVPQEDQEDEEEDSDDSSRTKEGYTTLAVPVSIADYLKRNPDIKTVDQLQRSLTRKKSPSTSTPPKRNSGIFKRRW